MVESVWNLNTSEIELRQQLPTLACHSLISCLLAERGVTDAKWVGDTRRLVVKYDADVFGCADLVDFVHARGIPVAAVRAGYAKAHETSSPRPLMRQLIEYLSIRCTKAAERVRSTTRWAAITDGDKAH